MGKVVFWIVVVFVLLFALRLWNAAKARARRDVEREAASRRAIEETTVRCVKCGTYVPTREAKPSVAGPTCGQRACSRG